MGNSDSSISYTMTIDSRCAFSHQTPRVNFKPGPRSSVCLQNMNSNWNSDGNPQPVTAPEPQPANPAVNNNAKYNISLNMSKDLVAAAGFNVEAPIVNALIGNLTGALPTKKRDATETVRCEICDCEISSNVILSSHINGSRHRKRLKALDIIAQLKAGGNTGIHMGDSDNPNAFRCEVCCLTVNSAQQLEFHLLGSKHKKKAAKVGVVESETSVDNIDKDSTPPSAKKKKKEETRLLTCDVCNVIMNSQIQYNQHLTSKKHLLKMNPSRYNQRRPTQFKGSRTQNLVNNLNNSNQNNTSQYMMKRKFPFVNSSNARSFDSKNSFSVRKFRQSECMPKFTLTQQY